MSEPAINEVVTSPEFMRLNAKLREYKVHGKKSDWIECSKKFPQNA